MCKEKTVTVAEAARLLGISRSSTYRAAHSGQLPALVIGKRVLVLREQLEGLLGSGFGSAGRMRDRRTNPTRSGLIRSGEEPTRDVPHC